MNLTWGRRKTIRTLSLKPSSYESLKGRLTIVFRPKKAEDKEYDIIGALLNAKSIILQQKYQVNRGSGDEEVHWAYTFIIWAEQK